MSLYAQTCHTLEEAFIYYTDCQVATLVSLMLKRSTPKCEITRQTDIARGMVERMNSLCPAREDTERVNQRFLEALAIIR